MASVFIYVSRTLWSRGRCTTSTADVCLAPRFCFAGKASSFHVAVIESGCWSYQAAATSSCRSADPGYDGRQCPLLGRIDVCAIRGPARNSLHLVRPDHDGFGRETSSGAAPTPGASPSVRVAESDRQEYAAGGVHGSMFHERAELAAHPDVGPPVRHHHLPDHGIAVGGWPGSGDHCVCRTH